MDQNEDITIEDLDKGRKLFRVLFWLTEGGTVSVKADSKAEAEQKIEDYISMYSNDDALQKRFDCTSREWEVLEVDTEEVQ